MEILKRARGHSDGDIMPFNADVNEIKEEVNKRTYKAGYTGRYGDATHGTRIQSVCDFDFLPTKINGKIIGD